METTEIKVSTSIIYNEEENNQDCYFEQLRKAEEAPTPTFNEIVTSYYDCDENAILPGVLLYRLGLELKRQENISDDFLQQICLKGFFAVQFANKIGTIPCSMGFFLTQLKEKTTQTIKNKTMDFAKLNFTSKNRKKIVQSSSKNQCFFDENFFNDLYKIIDDKKLKLKIDFSAHNYQMKMKKHIPFFSSEKPLSKIGNSLAIKDDSLFSLIIAFGHPLSQKLTLKFKKNQFDWLHKLAEIGDATAMHNMGVLVKDDSLSAKWFEKSYGLKFAVAAFQLGNLYAGKNQDKAIFWFKKAIEDGNTYAGSNLGNIYESQGKQDLAIFYYKKSNLVQAKLGLAKIYRSQENFKKALKYAKDALKQEESTISLDCLAKVYMCMGNYDMALNYFLKIADKRSDCMQNIGGIYAKKGEIKKAIKWWKSTIEQYKKELVFKHFLDTGPAPWLPSSSGDDILPHVIAAHNIGVFTLQMGNQDDAITYYKLSLKEGYAPSARNLGRIYYDKGEIQTAYSYFQKAVEMGDHYSILLSAICYQGDDLEEKELLFKKAIEFDVEDASVFCAKFLRDQGRDEEALEYEEDDLTEGDDTSDSEIIEDLSENEQEVNEAEVISQAQDSLEDSRENVTVIINIPGNNENQKKDVAPPSKKWLKRYHRAQKKLLEIPNTLFQDEKPQTKSYLDVELYVHPDAIPEVKEKIHELRKNLTYLANREKKRSRLELLNNIVIPKITHKKQRVDPGLFLLA